MHAQSFVAIALAAIVPLASAGVSIQGFTDTNCQSGVGNTIISTNGGCTKFNTGYTSYQTAGGGSAACVLTLYNSDDCTGDSVGTDSGINHPELGPCRPTTNTANSGFLSNCPT